MNPDKLNFILEGSEVRRFHALRTLTQETNGHHSHLVAMLCWELSHDENDTYARLNLIMAALVHDLSEGITGDIPSNIKRLEGVGRELEPVEKNALEKHLYAFSLTYEEQRILKLADNLAGFIFCVRERKMGNTLLEVVEKRYREYILSMHPFTGLEVPVVNTILY